jgi:hypothetical protein
MREREWQGGEESGKKTQAGKDGIGTRDDRQVNGGKVDMKTNIIDQAKVGVKVLLITHLVITTIASIITNAITYDLTILNSRMAVLDTILTILVGHFVVFYWRGTWGLIDYFSEWVPRPPSSYPLILFLFVSP